MNQSVSGIAGPLRVALVTAALLAPIAWVVQYLGAFPVPSAASSATAGTLVVGLFLALIVTPIAIYRLVRSPSIRTPASYGLTGICFILFILALTIGIALVGQN